jgi:hypothetical protein
VPRGALARGERWPEGSAGPSEAIDRDLHATRSIDRLPAKRRIETLPAKRWIETLPKRRIEMLPARRRIEALPAVRWVETRAAWRSIDAGVATG